MRVRLFDKKGAKPRHQANRVCGGQTEEEWSKEEGEEDEGKVEEKKRRFCEQVCEEVCEEG